MKHVAMAALTAAVSSAASAAFTGYTVVSNTFGGLTAYQLFGNFNGATDTVLSAGQINLVSGSTVFHHADAATGGVDSTVAGTWNPQFVLAPGAMDSFVCVGGGTGFASGNSTIASPDWGAAGWNQAQMPYGTTATTGATWFNGNPANNQGRVNASGQVLLGQFVIGANDAEAVIQLRLTYNNGVSGSPVQFGVDTFTIGVPAPGAIALLGLAGLAGRRRR